MKKIESVTALVNHLFSAYNQNINGLDWEEKITEYSDVINDFIDYDTDLNELYLQIRQNFANLPQPSSIKKIFNKKQAIAEAKEYIEHPDNNKLVLVICYKDGEIVQIRNHVLKNTPDTDRTLSKETKTMREIYDEVKVRIYPADVVLIGRKLHIPEEYNRDGECIKQRIEEVA